MKKLAEVLTGPDRWCQGALKRGHKRCLVGGLLSIVGKDWTNGSPSELEMHERARMRRVIRDLYRLPRLLSADHEPIAVWNDNPERTFDEVAAVVSEYDRRRMLDL